MKKTASNPHMRAYAALIFVDFVAAGTFLVAKETTTRFAPLELGWFRILLSFLLIMPIFLLKTRGQERRIPQGKDRLRLICMGLAGVTINQLLFLHGIHLAPALDGALFYSFTPVIVLLAARFFLGEVLTWRKVAGIASAIIGVFVVLRSRGLAFTTDYLIGDLILLGSVMAWATYTLLGKSLMGRYPAITANFWAFGTGALSLIPLGPYVLSGFDWSKPGLMGWLGLFYLSGMTSVVSFTLWTWALKVLDASRVAVFANLQPPLTALLAWMVLGELPTMAIIIGGILVITGVTLAQLRKTTKLD